MRSNLFFVGASYFVTPAFIVDSEVYHITNSEHDTRATMGTLRTTYLLSKRTAVYAQGSYLANSAKARARNASSSSGAVFSFGAMPGAVGRQSRQSSPSTWAISCATNSRFGFAFATSFGSMVRVH